MLAYVSLCCSTVALAIGPDLPIIESCVYPSDDLISLSYFDAGLQCKFIRTFFSIAEEYLPKMITPKEQPAPLML